MNTQLKSRDKYTLKIEAERALQLLLTVQLHDRDIKRQEYTNARCKVAVATKLPKLCPNITVSSVGNY